VLPSAQVLLSRESQTACRVGIAKLKTCVTGAPSVCASGPALRPAPRAWISFEDILKKRAPVRRLGTVVALFLASISGLAVAPANAQSVPLVSLCGVGDHFALSDDLSGTWSPCTTQPGKVFAEVTYLQNASAVGGTALATYPMLHLRTGITKNLEFVFQSPSQIAESGQRGMGLYPMTHLGYGLRYTVTQTNRFGLAVLAETLPPTSRFSPNQVQSRYLFGLTTEYVVNPKLALGFALNGTSSSSVGFGQIFPSTTVRAAYNVTPATQFSVDVGTRTIAQHTAGQSFGDVSFSQMQARNLAFNVGLGSAFNAVANVKAHYLASGFTYRP
jgi:hypothetical protein